MQNAHPFRRSHGFTLIELLIVMAIIGTMVAVAIPIFHSSVRKANEAAAVSTLNTIKLAQAKYAIDHDNQYGTFRELFDEGYLDKRFNSDQPHVKGYVFTLTLTPKSENHAATYAANADPEQSDGMTATGRNFYYLDPANGICFSKKGRATSSDDNL